MKPSTFFYDLYCQVYIQKFYFLVTFFVVILFSYTVLYIIDFIPVPVSADTLSTPVEETLKNKTIVQDTTVVNLPVEEIQAPIVTDVLPHKIIFDSLNKEILIKNPKSNIVEDLDVALLDGAVRHPDSADLSEDGTIFILAHSSYLPNVFNKNFQAFNGIQNLTWGDTIRLQSDSMEYLYRVDKVYKAKAAEVFVPETPGKAKLTLATCNSFGTKNDRFMVEATRIGSYKL